MKNSPLSLVYGSIESNPIAHNIRPLWPIFMILAILSSVSTIFLGLKSLALIGIILFIYLFLKYKIFPIGFFLVSIPFMMYFFSKTYIVGSFICSLVIMGLWLMRKMIRPEEGFDTHKFIIYFSIIFILVEAISGLNNGLTPAEYKSLTRFILFFIFIFVIYDLYSPKYTLFLIISITIPLLISSISLIWVYSTVRGLVKLLDLYRMKPGGIFTNSNLLGNCLALITPFWLALGIWSRKKRVRFIGFALSMPMTLALVLTNSRAAMLGFFITIFIFSIWAKKLRHFIIVTLAVALTLAAVPKIRTIISLGLRIERGTSSRTEIWGKTLKIIRQNYLLGIGSGNFPDAFIPYYETSNERNFFKAIPNAHNFLLHNFVELGFMGLVLAITILYYPIREGRRLFRRKYSVENRAVIYGLLGGVFALYGWSFFEGGGILGDGRLFPDALFWLLFCMILKINSYYDTGKIPEFWAEGYENNLAN
jgi:O-antigen ligase